MMATKISATMEFSIFLKIRKRRRVTLEFAFKHQENYDKRQDIPKK